VVIAETIAICQFLEENCATSGDKLFGNSAQERALVAMWQRRCEGQICVALFTAFRSGMARELFKDRGVHSFCCPENAEPQNLQASARCKWLNDLCASTGSDFIALDRITVVDIQLYAVLNFAKEFKALGQGPHEAVLDGCDWLQAWYARMDSRPSNAETRKS
jgi:glutathione S-transferase